MALTDFLEALLEDWDNVEATLSVAELVEAHRRAHLAEPFAGNDPGLQRDRDPADASGYLAQALARRLPDDHRAWEELAAEPSRFQRSPATDRQLLGMQRLLVNARNGLTGPDAPANAVSDYLTDAAQSRIIADCFAWNAQSRIFEGALYLPGVEVNFYPRFQFHVVADAAPWQVSESESGVAWLAGARGDSPEVRLSWGVHPRVLESREYLDPETDSLGSIGWWLSVNSWLGTEPAALLGTAREPEILPALAQLDNDSW